MKKAYLLFAILCIFSLSEIAAQKYQSAVGLRLGSPVGLNGKLFISETNALEGTVALRGSAGWSFIDVMGAFIFQNPLDLDEIENFDWYWGVGATVQFWRYHRLLNTDRFSGTAFGIQGHLGVEYIFDDMPLNIGIGWSPTIFFNRGGYYGSTYGWGRGFSYAAVTVRYILSR